MNSKQEFSGYNDYHSPRGSFTSASTNTSKFASTDYLTATSFSSIEQPSNSSSAIHYVTNSMTTDTSDFGIIDSLDYDDVDEAALGHYTDHEYMYRKREEVVDTLIRSEESYTNLLGLVQQYFLSPLKETKSSSGFNLFARNKPICTKNEYAWLFGNFNDLIEIHQFILHGLNERKRIWGPTQILSDVFQSWFPMLEAYRFYFDNYCVSITTYDRLTTRYDPFKNFLEKKNKEKALAQTDLLSLLQCPAACIPRYFETISQLSDMTPPMHPDYAGLLKCKQRMTRLKQNLNSRILDTQNVDKVYMIHQALDGCPFNDIAERRLVLQSNMCRVNLSTRSVGEERKYVLFNDYLVFAKVVQQKSTTRLQYKGHIVLDRARVRALTKEEAGGIAHCIELLPSMAGIDNLNTTYVATATTHVLYVGSEEERKAWVDHLNLVIQDLDKIAMMRQVQAHKKKIQERVPKGSHQMANMTHSMNSLSLESRSSSSKSSNRTS